MNEKEKRAFYIAMCNCCLIAQSMKCCSVCPFNIGLRESNTPIHSVAVFPVGIVFTKDGIHVEESSLLATPVTRIG